MRSESLNVRLIVFAALVVALLGPITISAQDDTEPLGDLARDIRKNRMDHPQPQPGPVGTVIDNDNLTQVMDEVSSARPIKSDKTVFSIDTATNTLKVSMPDATCSMSFNSKSSALMIRPVLIEDLPLTELLKIDGPGSIQDESLQLEVFNGTDWDIREITVGLTLERKPGENAELAARARVIPAAEGLAPPSVERRSDVTLLYHLKAQAKPFSTTEFRENIGITPGPDEDWRWSIVEAKGVRPSQTQPEPATSEGPLFAAPSALIPGSSGSPGRNESIVPLAPVTPSRDAQDKPNVQTPQQ
jgi:hypothetical protein